MFPIMAGSSRTGYNLTRSLRTRASASASLNRTPASAGNRQKFTLSFWTKRGAFISSDFAMLFYSYASTSDYFGISFDSLARLNIFDALGGLSLTTTTVYRDPASWYHFVIAIDTTQATNTDRARIYVNNVRVVDLAIETYPAQNTNLNYNNAIIHRIAASDYPSFPRYYDGYMTEINFVNALQLTPSSFGSTNALTGVWQHARYTGTYGTNGFYLPFTDNSALTTSSNVGLGRDYSGNGNYWVTNNISITAGVTYDSMTDVPTLTGDRAANFAVLNPIAPNLAGTPTISNANLFVNCASASNFSAVPATILLPTTGKWYAEFTAIYVDGSTSILDVGLLSSNDFPTPSGVIGGSATSYSYRNTGSKINSGAATAYGASYVIGDTISIAFDATAGTLTFYKNNVSQGVAFSGLTLQYFFAVGGFNFAQWQCNFGQRPFTYTPPSGFVALNTFNLPNSTIVKGSDHMNIALARGADIKATTEALFTGQFLEWIKDRINVNNHQLLDSVRGLSAVLQSNTTAAETTYTTPSGSSVGWAWKAGASAVSNTNGTITSQVSVNASAGFSIVTYTGTGANATIGHGLGVSPEFIIVKSRSGVLDWRVWHIINPATRYLSLNLSDAAAVSAETWNSTLPTSSVFSVGTALNVNNSGSLYVAYCWTPISGYSKFGSYTGNGSSDGPFVYTGFLPKWILIKMLGVDNWILHDTKRNPYNTMTSSLYPNLTNAEDQSWYVDALSNGFKIRSGGSTAMNTNGVNYIYMAFAENPFKNSLAR